MMAVYESLYQPCRWPMKFFSAKKVERSAMSDFIRNASSEKKNKIYREVLIKATKRQEDVIKRAPPRRAVATCG